MKSSQSLRQSFFFSLFGLSAPLVSGLASISILVRLLDSPRFAFVSLTWTIIGYASVLDLGLGRSLTKQVPSALTQFGAVGVHNVVDATIRLMYKLSAIGVLLTFAFGTALVGIFGHLSTNLWPEAYRSVLLIGITIPALVLSSGYRGTLEGLGHFKQTGIIRAGSGSLMFLGPLTVAFFSTRLELLTGSLVVTRYLTLVALRKAYKVSIAGLSIDSTLNVVQLPQTKSLLREAGWMTVSNVISPLLVYMDRFFVSRLLGLAVVPFYTAPYDVVSRLTIIPEAVFSVLFPRMSSAHVEGRDGLERVYYRSLRNIGILMFLCVLAIITVGPVFLKVVLGSKFAKASSEVMSILLIGIFVNTCARPAYNALQASGRSFITGAFHLGELIPYVALLIYSTSHFGIVGTAAAWLARASVDTTALIAACSGLMKRRGSSVAQLLIVALGASALATVSCLENWGIRASLGLALGFAALFLYWRFLASEDEISQIRALASEPFKRATGFLTSISVK